MHDMIRKTLATAALALLAAPMTYAMETAPSAPLATGAPATAASTLRPAAASAPGLFKADEFKETDVWGRIRSGYAIPDKSVNDSIPSLS